MKNNELKIITTNSKSAQFPDLPATMNDYLIKIIAKAV